MVDGDTASGGDAVPHPQYMYFLEAFFLGEGGRGPVLDTGWRVTHQVLNLAASCYFLYLGGGVWGLIGGDGQSGRSQGD